jgi:hypothetical protein
VNVQCDDSADYEAVAFAGMRRQNERNENVETQMVMLPQSAAESEEELQQKSVFASWRDGESAKSANRRKQISLLED